MRLDRKFFALFLAFSMVFGMIPVQAAEFNATYYDENTYYNVAVTEYSRRVQALAGVVPVQKTSEGKWGLVSVDGTPKTEFVYDSIEALGGKYFRVVKNGNVGVIDADGVEKIEPDGQIGYVYSGYYRSSFENEITYAYVWTQTNGLRYYSLEDWSPLTASQVGRSSTDQNENPALNEYDSWSFNGKWYFVQKRLTNGGRSVGVLNSNFQTVIDLVEPLAYLPYQYWNNTEFSLIIDKNHIIHSYDGSNVYTSEAYEDAKFTGDGRTVIVTKNGKKSVIDFDGSEIIPFGDYKDIGAVIQKNNDDLFISCAYLDDNNSLVSKIYKLGLTDPVQTISGKLVSTRAYYRDLVFSPSLGSRKIGIMTISQAGGNNSYTVNEAIPAEYDAITDDYVNYIVYKDQKYGVLSTESGEQYSIILNIEYDYIDSINSYPAKYRVCKNGKYGIKQNETAQALIPIEYNDIRVYSVKFIELYDGTNYSIVSIDGDAVREVIGETNEPIKLFGLSYLNRLFSHNDRYRWEDEIRYNSASGDRVESVESDNSYSYPSGIYPIVVSSAESTGVTTHYKDITTGLGDYTLPVEASNPSTGIFTYKVGPNQYRLGEIQTNLIATGFCGNPSVNEGKSVSWSLDENGKLTISGTGVMADYSYDSPKAPWTSYISDIKSVVVRSGVTRIGSCAFDGCVNLANVSIADTVTVIGNNSFQNCSKLTEITFPAGLKKIEHSVFWGSGLKSVAIPASVTEIDGYAFSNCQSLASVDWGTGLKTIAEYMFEGDTALKSFTIPAGITSISNTAFGGSGLNSIKVAAGNTSFVAEDNVLYNAGKTQLIYYPRASTRSSYILPDTISTVLLEQLSGPNLSEIRIPKDVTMTCDSVVTESMSNTNPITLYFEGDIPSSIENWAFRRSGGELVHVNAQKWIYNRVEKAIPDAVLYVPYVYDIKDDTLIVPINCNGLEDSGLEVSNNGIISGAPLETGKRVFKASSGANTYTLSVDVKTNNETAVDAMNSEELVIEQKIPNMVSTNLQNQVFEIEDEELDQGQSNFSKFRKVYLDGVELTGGKVGVGEAYTSVDSIPTDWQYYAEEGSTKITVLAQTFQNLSAGTHLIAATFVQTKTDAETGNEVEVQHVAAQNFTISTDSGNNGVNPNNNGGNTRNNDRDYSSDSSDSSDSSSSSQTTNRIADQGAIKDGKLSYTIAKGVATLAKYTSKQLSEAASQQKSSVFTIDLTGNGERVTKVSLPEGMMNQLAQLTADESNTVKSVRIVLSSGVIELDVSALAEIAKQIGGKAVSVSMEEVKAEQLPAEQQQAISELNAEKLVSIEIACGNQQVSDFGGGRVIISIPFARHSDRNMRGYAVWHISEEGNAARHSTGFAEEQLSFRTAHLSIYAVAYQEAKLFNDVPDGTWYTHDVDHVAGLKLMNGVGNNWFGANEELSRAMFAQIIYNAEKGEAGAESVFADVSDDAWYADAVNWAAKAGIVSGIGNGEFAPERNITREELVTMLYKYAGYKNYALTNSTSLSRFEDEQKVSNWARTAMEWAVGNKLINGISGALAANSSATRAQTAKVLTYFLEQYEK